MTKPKTVLRKKRGVRLAKHDPLKTLLNEKLIAQAFWDCLRKEDMKGAAEIVLAHKYALDEAQKTKVTAAGNFS